MSNVLPFPQPTKTVAPRETRKLQGVNLKALPPGKHADGDGLALLVKYNDARVWIYRYRHGGRPTQVVLGNLLDTTLAEARAKLQGARPQVRDGVSPTQARRAAKTDAANTFDTAAREWLERRMSLVTAGKLQQSSYDRERNIVERYTLPVLGKLALTEIEVSDITKTLFAAEKLGRTESVTRALNYIDRIMKLAIATGRAKHNVAGDFDPNVLHKHETHKHPGLTDPEKVGELLRKIDGYTGRQLDAAASNRLLLTLTAHIVLRSYEVRSLEWDWVNFGKAEIRLPGWVMKMKRPHVVPLSRQALKLLADAKKTSSSKWVFPSPVKAGVTASYEAPQRTLRELGYSTRDDHCMHGFRTTFSTLMNNMSRSKYHDLVELQLSHIEENKVAGAYNEAESLNERREMMQTYSDYLDQLKGG